MDKNLNKPVDTDNLEIRVFEETVPNSPITNSCTVIAVHWNRCGSWHSIIMHVKRVIHRSNWLNEHTNRNTVVCRLGMYPDNYRVVWACHIYYAKTRAVRKTWLDFSGIWPPFTCHPFEEENGNTVVISTHVERKCSPGISNDHRIYSE